VTPRAARRIEAVWSFSASKSGSAIVLPDGRCDIILRNHVSTPDQITPILTGPGTQPYRVAYDTGDQWFGIRLRPEQGAALWQEDLGKACDQVMRGAQVLDRLPALATLRSASLTLETLARMVPPRTGPDVGSRLTRAIDILHATGGRLRIHALAAIVACTARHLNRLFRRNVGLCVKTYAQLIQFHRALGLITQGKLPIAAAAFESGYSDHAHMARSFRRFGGFTPGTVPPDLSLPGIISNEVRFVQDRPGTGAV